jgi:glycosyltransferase involved in cell wall biosynthesis
MNFSFCIITKNESAKLDKCLSCLSALGEDIAVLDTGSTDNSIETALKYTSNVHSCEWSDDFSAARNLCATYAQNDRIICIDSDEYLIPIDKAFVIAELESNPYGI